MESQLIKITRAKLFNSVSCLINKSLRINDILFNAKLNPKLLKNYLVSYIFFLFSVVVARFVTDSFYLFNAFFFWLSLCFVLFCFVLFCFVLFCFYFYCFSSSWVRQTSRKHFHRRGRHNHLRMWSAWFSCSSDHVVSKWQRFVK